MILTAIAARGCAIYREIVKVVVGITRNDCKNVSRLMPSAIGIKAYMPTDLPISGRICVCNNDLCNGICDDDFCGLPSKASKLATTVFLMLVGLAGFH